MNNDVKHLAIIGPTASGKSDLAIAVAKKIDAFILSIDSLSIYKEIDIVSAKPSNDDLQNVKHFGINLLHPNEYFSVEIFLQTYKQTLQTCKQENKNLIIVGGTSFYLKALLEGLSSLPMITQDIYNNVKKELTYLKECYEQLRYLDPHYMSNISANDTYRIEKAYLIYKASGMTPTQWFLQNPPQPLINSMAIYNIDVERDLLRKRIKTRTHKMLSLGLIDEICKLEQKYTRSPHSMKSIGILEVLEYLDGKVSKEQMLDNISLHTAQLAKRQQTFNRTQFASTISAPLEELQKIIEKNLK